MSRWWSYQSVHPSEGGERQTHLCRNQVPGVAWWEPRLRKHQPLPRLQRVFRTELWSANTHTVLFLALGTLINNQTFFFSIIPELMETFDFPSLSRKMPSQILGRGLENQPRDFRRRKTFFFFFIWNQVSWTNCTVLGLQIKTEGPSGAWSLENRLVILRTPWAGASSPSQRRVFPGWNIKMWEKSRKFKSFPAQRFPFNTAALFGPKWIPRVTDGPILKFQQQQKPKASDF